ncbi:MAG: hypothetical protein Q8927_07025 [Bacteroidota bacterium]|nr:hypothetical protein [Bacteroidota bacterium]MDP4215937.1 hypothetical protein [Bacteroidota bacterium]MDP4245214.1 hypothetical protein [Bacteroidota bacterium]MDP4253986.1 hypothetical protein [Bacteroidota bacterium]MDP4259206.1 hypothetical protein [Bacteroidota bacterium]
MGNSKPFFHFLLLIFFCTSSCTRIGPPGMRTLATYNRPNGKKLFIGYVDHGSASDRSIQVVLASEDRKDSVLAKFQSNYLQFSHLKPNSTLIIALRKDTTSVNLDTYIVKIPD